MLKNVGVLCAVFVLLFGCGEDVSEQTSGGHEGDGGEALDSATTAPLPSSDCAAGRPTR